MPSDRPGGACFGRPPDAPAPATRPRRASNSGEMQRSGIRRQPADGPAAPPAEVRPQARSTACRPERRPRHSHRPDRSQPRRRHLAPKHTMTTTTNTPDAERELAVLQAISEDEHAPQRDIARSTGMSLGMTNAVLKRLSQKGLVTVRKVKGRHMRYAITPDGVHEIARPKRRFTRVMVTAARSST